MKIANFNQRTCLYKPPENKAGWVFRVDRWPARGTQTILSALRMTYVVLTKREQIIVITPMKGHEEAVWNVCRLMFFPVEKNEAERLLKKAQISSDT